MYNGGDFGKCTFPECDAAESIESGGSDAKSETENLTQLTLFHCHITHTHTLTHFQLAFAAQKSTPKGTY